MSLKTVATFAIIIGCFAVLYPKFLHPMLTRLFGPQSKSSMDGQDATSQMYPPGRRPEDRRPPNMPPNAGDVRQHMRPGPHPGMRAAAEMHRQQSQHGSGRGMMGIVLPMYAVGIVLYLVYTLVKVFGKKDKALQSAGESNQSDYSQPPRNTPTTPEEKTRELQNLLLKADDKSISSEEMKELQKRLEETESQMSQILKAMQMVQNKVGKMEPDIPEELPKQRQSPDSSPDMDSYEIVNKSEKSDRQTGGSSATTPDVDNIGAQEMQAQHSTPASTQEKDTKTEDRQTESSQDDKEAGSEDAVKRGDECGPNVDNKNKDDVKDDDDIEEDSQDEDNEEEEEEEVILGSSEEEEDSDQGSSVRHRQVPQSDPH